MILRELLVNYFFVKEKEIQYILLKLSTYLGDVKAQMEFYDNEGVQGGDEAARVPRPQHLVGAGLNPAA